MKRTSVNPWDWGLQFGMDQGEVVEGVTRTPHCLLGVNRLVMPDLMVEIEATAGA